MNYTEKRNSQVEFFNEPIDEYHKSGALSSTHLRCFIESKNKFLNLLNNPLSKSGDALDLGSALHCMVLEFEEFNRRYAICPEVDRRTKEGKEIWENFSMNNDHKMLLKKEQYDTCKIMSANIYDSTIAKDLLKNSAKEECARVKLSNGLTIQCRPDAHKKNNIIDIKTCQDVKDFKWDIKKHGYDIQAAFYYFILNSLYPETYGQSNFYFIAVDKTAINEVKVFGIDNNTLNDLVERKLKPTLIEIGEFLKVIPDIKNYKYEQTEIEWINL